MNVYKYQKIFDMILIHRKWQKKTIEIQIRFCTRLIPCIITVE